MYVIYDVDNFKYHSKTTPPFSLVHMLALLQNLPVYNKNVNMERINWFLSHFILKIYMQFHNSYKVGKISIKLGLS